MEEIFVYGLLMGFNNEIENLYNEKLDELFLKYPDNSDFLELELLCGNVKESMIYIKEHISFNDINIENFEKKFIECLKILYNDMNIKDFSELSYKIWNVLPEYISQKDPFILLCYAGDSLSWGDELSAKENFERIFSYYE